MISHVSYVYKNTSLIIQIRVHRTRNKNETVPPVLTKTIKMQFDDNTMMIDYVIY